MFIENLMFIVICIIAFGVLIPLWVFLYHATCQRKKKDPVSVQLFVGDKIYRDYYSGKDCKRCNKGRIAERRRFVVVSKLELKETTTIYWCDNCRYRGVNPK
jgi:hypothetical protein